MSARDSAYQDQRMPGDLIPIFIALPNNFLHVDKVLCELESEVISDEDCSAGMNLALTEFPSASSTGRMHDADNVVL